MRATTVKNEQRTGYYGAIAEGREITWKCDHFHPNRDQNGWIPAASSYAEFPLRLSALSCARRELKRRESVATTK